LAEFEKISKAYRMISDKRTSAELTVQGWASAKYGCRI